MKRLGLVLLCFLQLIAHGQITMPNVPAVPSRNSENKKNTPSQTASPEATAMLVLYNQNVPESKTLAEYYAAQRGVPKDQIVGLDCSAEEEIMRSEYNASIVWPLRALFGERKWWKLQAGRETQFEVTENKIRYIAVMYGMPLKIKANPPPVALPTPYTPSYAVPGASPTPKPTPPPPPAPEEREESSVDSELAIFGLFLDKPAGPMRNPYFQSNTPFLELNVPGFMLTARLDASSPQIVKRMIDDAIATEKTGLYGMAYIDSRNIKSGGYAEGDTWLTNITNELRTQGIPVLHENTAALFPKGYAMREAALYYGWYTEHVNGPFLKEGFKFRKGAIACHIHSFNAKTLRNLNQFWSAPLLARGAAATVGNVYEPYLDLTHHLDIFQDRLLRGFTLIDAAWMSLKTTSWMNIVLGDPLYRPYGILNGYGDFFTPKPSADKAYDDFREKMTANANDPERQLQIARQLLQQTGSTLFLEALASQLDDTGQHATALKAYRQAREQAKDDEDKTRILVHEIRSIQQHEGKEAALAYLRKFPHTHEALQAVEFELDPPPPPAPQNPAPKKL